MQDAIIKGTGNSRYLKSVSNFATLYPTYADFVQALVEGTLPIDLNGINAAGFTQTGTALNKANLLSDSTETAIFGNTGNRTVDATLSKLLDAIQTVDGRAAKIQVGSYVGTGTYGESNPCSLTFNAKPQIVSIVLSNAFDAEKSSTSITTINIPRLSETYESNYGFTMQSYAPYSHARFNNASNTLEWYTTRGNAAIAYNDASTMYTYIVVF